MRRNNSPSAFFNSSTGEENKTPIPLWFIGHADYNTGPPRSINCWPQAENRKGWNGRKQQQVSYFQVRKKNRELKPTDHSINYCVSSPSGFSLQLSSTTPTSLHVTGRPTCNPAQRGTSVGPRAFPGPPIPPNPRSQLPSCVSTFRGTSTRSAAASTNPILFAAPLSRVAAATVSRVVQLCLLFVMIAFPHDMAVVPFVLIASPLLSSSHLSCAPLPYPLSIHPTHPCTYA